MFPCVMAAAWLSVLNGVLPCDLAEYSASYLSVLPRGHLGLFPVLGS